MKNRKTKHENPGLEGHLNPRFGFEKVSVTLVFGFGQKVSQAIRLKHFSFLPFFKVCSFLNLCSEHDDGYI